MKKRKPWHRLWERVFQTKLELRKISILVQDGRNRRLKFLKKIKSVLIKET